MNVHKNARLTVVRRLELVKAVLDLKVCIRAAAMEAAVSVTTARKWIARYRALGPAGLSDRSSRPLRSPRAIAPQQVLSIIDWRKKRLTQARIAGLLGRLDRHREPGAGARRAVSWLGAGAAAAAHTLRT